MSNPDVYRTWALGQAPIVPENLIQKYLAQLDRQASSGKSAADHVYAEASARLASHEIDLGNSGTKIAISPPHFAWASRNSIERLREELEIKVRAIIVGASDSPAR